MHKKSLSIILSVFLLAGTAQFTYAAPTLGDRWNQLKDDLTEAESGNYYYASTKLKSAEKLYETYFKEAALDVDPETDQIIENTFDYNREHIKTRDLVEAGFNRQAIDKSIYKIAFMKVQEALEKGDDDSFFDWYSVLDKKFLLSKNPDLKTNEAILEIKDNPNNIYKHRNTINQELLEIFKIKTVEEIEEAIAAVSAGKTNDAIKFTYEGYYYYRSAHPALVSTAGEQKAALVESAMKDAMQVARSGQPNVIIKSDLEQILNTIEPIVRGYEGASADAIALHAIKDRLALVEEEYEPAVKSGKLVDKVEYDETIAFLSKAQEIYDKNKDSLKKLDEAKIEQLGANLEKLKGIVDSYGEFSELKPIVTESIIMIENLNQGTTVTTSPTDYISEIKNLLGQAKTQYQSGNADAAFDLVTAAYLDNYEFVEKDLAELDLKLMEQIEIMMREELREMIKNKDTISEVDNKISLILDKLQKAEDLLSGKSPLKSANKVILPLAQQSDFGIKSHEVQCGDGKMLILKQSTKTSACVSESSFFRLVKIGWGTPLN